MEDIPGDISGSSYLYSLKISVRYKLPSKAIIN